MRRIFLFSELGELSPAKRALTGIPAALTSRVLRGTYLDCPIALPPDLVLLEPAQLRPVEPLGTLLANHPVLSRVPWLIVLDPENVHVAAGLTCADFVLRGFAAQELVVRVERLVGQRRVRESALRSGPLALDLQGHQATVDGAPITITPQEFALLRYLVQNAERTLSRDQLVQRVWGDAYTGSARTVDIHVRRLRVALGRQANRIQTVRHVGYRWLGA